MSLDVQRFISELRQQLRGELITNHLNQGMADAVRFASFIAMLGPTKKEIAVYVREHYSISDTKEST